MGNCDPFYFAPGATKWLTFKLWGLSKKLIQSKEKKFSIRYASEISPKEFYFGVE